MPEPSGADPRPRWLHHLLPMHLRTTRRSWLFVLVVAFGAASIVQGVWTLARVNETTVPGVYYNRIQRVIPPLPVAAAAAGVATDDRIAGIDGHRFASSEELTDYLAHVPIGVPISIELDRDGAPLHAATLTTFAPRWATAWLRFLVGVVFVLLGAVVFWFHPGRRESWAFLFGNVALGVTILATFALPRVQTELEARAALFAMALVGPMLLHLFAVFPRPLRSVVRRPALLLALDLGAIAVGIAGAALEATRYATWFVRATAAINLVAVVLALGVLVWRSRRAAPRSDMSRLRAVVFAVSIGFPIPAAIAVLTTFRWWVPSDDHYLWAFSIAILGFPIVVGHAIVRRDLLAVDRAVARAAALSSIAGVIALGFVAVALVLPRLVAPDSVVGSPGAMALVVLGGIGALWPVYTRVQRWLVVRFAPDDSAERLAMAREAVALLDEAEDAAVCGRFERRLEAAFDVPDAALVVKADGGWLRRATGERIDPTTWSHVIDLLLDDSSVGAITIGRPGTHHVLAPATTRALAELAVDVARALRASHRGDRIGDYRIERFLAAGGMGNVYLGTKMGASGFEKPVAIKKLLPELVADADAVARFHKEARLVARLSHPGIVQTLELGESDHGYFIVMEYVDGIDAATLLRRLAKRRGVLPLPLACHIVTSTCLALDHAHRATDENGEPLRIVHHDISPHNVMIDGEGNIKLADFGVARVRHDPHGQQLVGKIGYMAPEQLRREPVDHRADVFAAGVVLFELVTGQHPFAAGSDFLTLQAIESGRFMPAETLREDCPLALATTIDRALALDPSGRHATAAELAEAIQRTFPLDSRHAAELGQLVRSVRDDRAAAASMPIGVPTRTLPTARS